MCTQKLTILPQSLQVLQSHQEETADRRPLSPLRDTSQPFSAYPERKAQPVHQNLSRARSLKTPAGTQGLRGHGQDSPPRGFPLSAPRQGTNRKPNPSQALSRTGLYGFRTLAPWATLCLISPRQTHWRERRGSRLPFRSLDASGAPSRPDSPLAEGPDPHRHPHVGHPSATAQTPQVCPAAASPDPAPSQARTQPLPGCGPACPTRLTGRPRPYAGRRLAGVVPAEPRPILSWVGGRTPGPPRLAPPTRLTGLPLAQVGRKPSQGWGAWTNPEPRGRGGVDPGWVRLAPAWEKLAFVFPVSEALQSLVNSLTLDSLQSSFSTFSNVQNPLFSAFAWSVNPVVKF